MRIEMESENWKKKCADGVWWVEKHVCGMPRPHQKCNRRHDYQRSVGSVGSVCYQQMGTSRAALSHSMYAIKISRSLQ